eukprot:TRINITY_DN299_c0_g1_i1.p1 TRINITY_DN299_c0_g1~~TRINITY_DN299_c0_g1_i1.p1  ORF type:complete len:611 (+),score=138.96 TRINITY_DN299_c0_g1_i1:46-1878(+)
MKHYCIVTFLLCILFTLSTSRLIQWTRAGGTASWDYGPNWDSNTVPTATDDVVIDLTLIDGVVQIGAAPAFCNSLKIGGSSGRPQTLTILNALTVGTGGAQIMSNGRLFLQSSPTSPLTSLGVFQGGSTFVFESGTLAGSGSFSFDYLALNGSALKTFSSKVSVAGIVDVFPGNGLGVVNINSASLTIGGTLRTTSTVTVSSMKSASLQVTGMLSFSGGATDIFTIRGDANIAKLNVVSGTVTLNDNVTVTSSVVAAGAFINVIGDPTSIRSFGDISGAGSLTAQGGINTVSSFTKFGGVQLSGGTLITKTNPSVLSNLVQTGGTLTGTGPITISTASWTNALITKATLNIASLKINGFSSIDASTISLNVVVIGSASQLTLSNAAQITVLSTGDVSQSGPFKIIPSSSGNSLMHNGKWTSTSDLQLLITTSGTGSFQFGTGSTTSITGISFTTGYMTFTDGQFNSVSSVVTVNNIEGSGTITSSGQSFTVLDFITADSYTNINGITTVGGAAIETLDIATGTYNVTGTMSTSVSFSFEGGAIYGAGSAKTQLTAGSIKISGNQFKSIQDITMKTSNLTLQCGATACQLATTDATITTSTQSGQLHLFEK